MPQGRQKLRGTRPANPCRLPLVRLLAGWIAVLLAVSAHAETAASPAYIGTDRCTACHAAEANAWDGSHHALAWTLPSAETVLGDFDNRVFSLKGMTSRFHHENGVYGIEVTDTDGSTRDYPVHSVAGVKPLQQYLLETEPGRLQSFDVVWDTVRKQWYDLYPGQVLPPTDGMHWTGPYKNWNGRCAECHATDFRKAFDADADRFSSTQSEIGVGCEACHGPGEAHVAWAEKKPMTAQGWPGPEALGLTIRFGKDAPETEIQQCAGCHSLREAFGEGNPLPGTPYNDAYNLSLLRPSLFHADGQIQSEVYIYNSFLQSKMYKRGVRCSNCHETHSATLKAEGNAVCTQCHNPGGNPEFPTLRPALFDDPAHHFHAQGSEGAQCTSCHMIERIYMGIDGRHDHSFRIPRPDLSAETASPDACTDCHTDKTPSWAASAIAGWYPQSDRRGPHFGQTLAKGRADPVAASGSLADLALDTEQAGIVRATALWLLAPAANTELATQLAPLLSDPDALVRASALDIQRAALPQERVGRVEALLSDPVRSVRLAAARHLLDVPAEALSAPAAAALRLASSDWQDTLRLRLDFPETHLVLGGMALTLRNPQAATGAFREAVRLDPQLTDAWGVLVRLAAATEGPPAAAAVLQEARAINPDDPQLAALAQELEAWMRN